MLRHYSRYIDVAHCKGRKIGHGTVGTSVESRRLGTRNVPTQHPSICHSHAWEGQKSFGTFLFQEKYVKRVPKVPLALWIQHLRSAVKQLMSIKSGALVAATLPSRATEKEYQKLRPSQFCIMHYAFCIVKPSLMFFQKHKKAAAYRSHIKPALLREQRFVVVKGLSARSAELFHEILNGETLFVLA